MSDNVKNFIDKLQSGDNADAGEAFKNALRDKVGDQLDTARQNLAANMFTGEALPISDEKPAVADRDPNPYKVVDTTGAEMNLEAPTPPAQEAPAEPVEAPQPEAANEPEGQ